MTDEPLPSAGPSRRIAAAIIAGISLAMIGGGYWYYRAETEELFREKHQTLKAITELKVKQIEQWRKERLAEAKRAGDDLLTLQAVGKFLGAPDDPRIQAQLREALEGEVSDYANILLFDPDANLLFATRDGHRGVPAATRQIVLAAPTKPEAVMSDFFRSPDGTVHIDVAAAVRDSTGRPLAVLVLRSHAIDQLFALLEFWPIASPSTETILSQKEGEEVVLVKHLRSAASNNGEMRFPLTLAHLPSVQAALGTKGRFEGRDHNNVAVLSDLNSISGSSWSIVTKVNQEELLAIAGYRAVIISLVIALAILLTVALAAHFYRRRQGGLLRALIHGERRQAEARKTLEHEQAVSDTIIDSIPGAFYMLDQNGQYVRWNACQRDEIVGKGERIATTNAIDTIHPDDRELISSKIANVLRNGEPETVEGRVLLCGGPAFRWLLMTGRQVVANGRPFLLGIGIDITERKQSEEVLRQKLEELERFNRLTVDREVRMIALKQEINALLKAAGQPEKYRIVEELSISNVQQGDSKERT